MRLLRNSESQEVMSNDFRQQCLRLVDGKPVLQHRLDVKRIGEGINFHNKLQKVKDQDAKRCVRKASGTSSS